MSDDLTEDLTPGGGETPPPPAPPDPAVPPAHPEPPAEDSTHSFVRNTIVMSTGTAISRLTGFLRLSAMAFAIGITETRLADAYNVANITPNILYELALGGILTSVVVPVVVEWMQARGREVAWDVVRRLFTIAIVLLSAIALLGIVLAPWIVDLYTVGYPDAQREAVHGLATFFLRWFMPQVVFYGIGAVAAGLLNAHRRFAAPMFAPIANNVIVIATTPSVVPIARTSCCAPVASSPGFDGSGIAAKIRNVAITITLLAIGANIGAANRRCAFSRPAATAPIP